MDKKSLSAILIIIVCGLAGTAHFTKAQTGTNVDSQIITQNTTWTQAGSPYTLLGPVDVAKGTTLTIDAGVTVDFGYQLTVDGTLNAKGSSTQNIIFTTNFPKSGSYVVFDNNSTGIIENAIFNSQYSIQSANVVSIIIDNCVFRDGSGISALGADSPATITNNYFSGGVAVEDATVSNNTFLQGIDLPADAAPGVISAISGNNITNPGGTVVTVYGAATISDNIISGGSIGIYLSGGATIQGNLIVNNGMGISTYPIYGGGVIDNNTIANNSGGGIEPTTGADTINFNNLENNGQFNLASASSGEVSAGYGMPLEKYTFPVNATYNWWGTTDTQAINQTIDDNYIDYNLGTVTFVPFLAAPNSQAPSINTVLTTPTQSPTPVPTSSPSQSSTHSPSQSSLGSPSPSATQPEFSWLESAIFAALIVIVALLSVIIALLLRRKPQKTAISP